MLWIFFSIMLSVSSNFLPLQPFIIIKPHQIRWIQLAHDIQLGISFLSKNNVAGGTTMLCLQS